MSQSNIQTRLWLIVSIVVAFGLYLLVGFFGPKPAPVPVAPPPVPTHEAESKPDDDAATQTSPATRKERRSVAEREELDRTLWAPEVQAQKHEEVIIALWDNLRKSPAPLAVLKSFPFNTIHFAAFGKPRQRPYGIIEQVADAGEKEWSAAEFRDWVGRLEREGFRLVQSEWHHSKFEPGTNAPNRSLFSFGIDAVRADTRYSMKGKFTITWQKQEQPDAPPRVDRIAVTELTLRSRSGRPAFVEVDLFGGRKLKGMPVLAADLDRDGLSEIVFPEAGLLLKNLGDMKFEESRIPNIPPKVAPVEELNRAMDTSVASVIGDFTQDGRPDMVIAFRKLGVFLYPQGKDGGFNSEPINLLPDADEIIKPYVMSAGDFNGDGLLDLWFAQYREPYRMGQMPDPMFDANDGFPAYLLANRGNGKFEDVTEAAGLGAKRHRRTFSGSFWDPDRDGDLDLLVVSDFSGVDLYENDGKGHFTDVTARAIDERANFGMGHTFADFNRDGHMDFYVTGMSSTTARRLEALGLKREGFPEINDRRMAMAYGNRMYLNDGKGHFRQPAFKDKVARTGWSWGTAHFDFANDGRLDIYVANGHRSGETCKDYCTRFWTHDVYVSKAMPQSSLIKALEVELNEWADTSWNGYEKNHLFIDAGDNDYFNAAFPLDVAFEYDSRSVIAEDFDNDGRVDLLISRDIAEGSNFRVKLYRNVWEPNGNWIGIRLQGEGRSTESGARIIVRTADAEYHEIVATGDSLACQHSSARHFGLGQAAVAQSVTVIWPDGKTSTLKQPAINRWHIVKAP